MIHSFKNLPSSVILMTESFWFWVLYEFSYRLITSNHDTTQRYLHSTVKIRTQKHPQADEYRPPFFFGTIFSVCGCGDEGARQARSSSLMCFNSLSWSLVMNSSRQLFMQMWWIQSHKTFPTFTVEQTKSFSGRLLNIQVSVQWWGESR